MLNLAFIFAIVCGLFDTKRICTGLFYFTLNGLTPPHFLYLSQAGTYIFNTICHGLFRVNFFFRREVVICFVDICRIVDRYCLNLLFIIVRSTESLFGVVYT